MIGLFVVPASASAGLSPFEVYFPATLLGETSAAQTVALTNNSGSSMPVSVTLDNDSTAFLVDSSACPAQLAPAASCDLKVAFKPVKKGHSYSELKITGTTYYAALMGSTPQPKGEISPDDTQDFGFVEPGNPTTKHFTVTSTGAIALPIVEVYTSGYSGADFTVVQPDACVGDLEPGATCEFDVRFDPEPGWDSQREAILVAMDADDNTLLLVELTGSTTVAEYTVTPTSSEFGDAAIGSGLTRTPKTFTITSTGDAPLPFAGTEILGDHISSYPAETTCPQTIAIGQSCSVDVSFDPTSGSTGPRPAVLTIKAGINANHFTMIPMIGTAVDAPIPPDPPIGKANLALKLKSAKRIKRGRTLVLKASVTNTGDATATSVTLSPKVPKKLAKKAKAVKIPLIAAGQTVTKKIKIKVKKSAKRGKKLTTKVSATAPGLSKRTAKRVVRIR